MSAPAALKAYAKQHGLTRGALARRLGVSEGFLSLLIAKRRSPGLGTALRIEEATEGAVPATAWVKRSRRASRTNH